MSEYIVEIPEEPAKVVRDGWNVRIEWQYKQREEIVRCCDCKHFTYADATHRDDDWCAKHDHIGWSVNGYCAWGERRDA